MTNDFTLQTGKIDLYSAINRSRIRARGEEPASEKKKGDHYDTYYFTVKSVTLFDDSNWFAWITLPDNWKQMLSSVYSGGGRCTAGKGEFIKRMRYRYQIDSRCCGGTMNLPVFAQKMLMDYKYKRLTLHQWKRQALGWYLGTAAIAAAGIRYYQLQHNQGNLLVMQRGIAAITVLTLLMVLWCDSRYKEKRLLIQMQDYLSHSGIAADTGDAALEEWKEAQETTSNAGRQKQEVNYESRAQREKRQLQDSLSRIKGGEKETAASEEKDWSKERNREILKQMDAKEQERIIREVLAEFLA